MNTTYEEKKPETTIPLGPLPGVPGMTLGIGLIGTSYMRKGVTLRDQAIKYGLMAAGAAVGFGDDIYNLATGNEVDMLDLGWNEVVGAGLFGGGLALHLSDLNHNRPLNKIRKAAKEAGIEIEHVEKE